MGTLTRKTAPYQKWPRITPVATGPIAPAAPTTAAQIAMALVRSLGGNTFTKIDNVDGMMNAAPSPIAARRRSAARWSRGGGDGSAEVHDEPELQRALAPVPVAEGACSEQQPGEDEGVGGDRSTAVVTQWGGALRDSVGIATLRLVFPRTR